MVKIEVKTWNKYCIKNSRSMHDPQQFCRITHLSDTAYELEVVKQKQRKHNDRTIRINK